jgi:hypothetical protein
MRLFLLIVSLFAVASHANIIFNIPDNLPDSTNTLIFGVDVAEIHCKQKTSKLLGAALAD